MKIRGPVLALAVAVLAAACAAPPPEPQSVPPSPVATPRAVPPAPLEPIAWAEDSRALQHLVLNRVTWGANAPSARTIAALGTGEFLTRQLRPDAKALLPPEVQAHIDSLAISRQPVSALLGELERRRREMQDLSGEGRSVALQAYQRELTALGREAQARMLLRAIYSPNQLHELATWFWMNHFSVFQFKANLRALVGDYEERAIRPHALGRFRDLLGATARHPAMLIYLDNARNAAGGINENYARELMELHTLGLRGGYTQQDVEALARVLTGFGVRDADFWFFAKRHDWGEKVLLGRAIRARGEAELDEALDRLAEHPATSRFLARKLAMHFVADEPPEPLVERAAARFRETGGDIAATLRALFESSEFRASLGGKFKDPLHYLVSAVRFVVDERPIPAAEVGGMINALARMGQPLYGRPTPDGYPLTRAEWASPGQLATRFEIARAVAYRSPSKLPAEIPGPLSASTRKTLEKAASDQEWNMLLLSSPEFMKR